VPPAPDQFPRSGRDDGRHRHREQVRPAGARQARLQSHQLRAGGDDPPDRQRLGLAWPVGQHGRLRLPARVRGRPRGEPRGTERCNACVSHRLGRTCHGTIGLARRTAQHSAAPARERRTRAVRLLHDLGSEDHAGLAERARPVRGASGSRRLGRAVQAVPNERSVVVARALLGRRPPDRPAAPGSPIRLGPSGRPPHSPDQQHERRTP